MIVVSDTSVLNYLLLLGEVDLLLHLFGGIVLPYAVQQEMLHPAAPQLVRQWAASPPTWVSLRSAEALLVLPELGPGETEAISLAITLKAALILIDERKGRRIAREHGLALSGTLVVLEEAARRGLVEIAEVLTRLKDTSFHISEQVVQDILTRARQKNETA